MQKNMFNRAEATTALITILLATTLALSFTPKTSATPELTISINPTSGPVGTEVKVNGTIDTLNGLYTIRWNATLNVTTGRATGYNITASFIIPPTVGAPSPGRDVLIELIDNNKTLDNLVDTTFKLYTEYSIKAVAPSPPSQVQEGGTTDIQVSLTGGEANTAYIANITVKEPSPASLTYWTTLELTNTTTTGSGYGVTKYPSDFTIGAHTDYAGTYSIALNQTLASGAFTVGLTNATEYHKFEVVNIRATGYTQAGESAWVNITRVETGMIVFSENVPAVGNIIETDWTIPSDASMGTYTVTLTSSTTPGTIKPVHDNQTFTVVKIPFQVQTVRLDGEAFAWVTVEIYDAKKELVSANITRDDGLASFSVEGGSYSLNASLIWGAEQVPVGTLPNQTIRRNATLTLKCWVSNVRIAIDPPLPGVNITLTHQNITNSFESDANGVASVLNVPTNLSYTIEARGYGSLFNTTNIERLPAKMNATWANITITRPTYTLSVDVLDSKETPLQNVEAAVYEWGGGVAKPVESETTDDKGSAVFRLRFGRYRIWIYNEDQLVLNKTIINLSEDQSIVIHCKISNVDLSVIVKDYLGRPISNALCLVEREGVSTSQRTKKGVASFQSIIGGDSQISVSVGGKVYETRTLYLDESEVISVKLERIVVVAGYLLEVVQLITYVSLGIIVTVFALALIYRRYRVRKTSK